MDAQSAELLLCAITAVGAIVWLAGLQFLIRSFPTVVPDDQAVQQSVEQQRPPTNWICGTADVEGAPAELVPKAVAILVSGNAVGIGPVKILQRGDDRVAFEGVAGDSHGRQSHIRVRYGQLRFTPLGQDQTSIQYVVQVADARWLLWLAALFQCLGLVALVVGFCLIQVLVAPNPEPAVRWQTVQMAQVVHFLWPPFLFAGLYRYGRRTLRSGLDLLVHNLPYQDA